MFLCVKVYKVIWNIRDDQVLIFKELPFIELLRFSCCSCFYWGLLGCDSGFIVRTTCCCQACLEGLTVPFLSCYKKHFGPERGVFLSTCLIGLHRAPFLYPHPMDLGGHLPCLYSNKFLPWRQVYIHLKRWCPPTRLHSVDPEDLNLDSPFNFGLHLFFLPQR